MKPLTVGSINRRLCPGSLAVPARTGTDGKGVCPHCFGWFRLRDDSTLRTHVRAR
jgi:hypothetical protein